MNDTLESALDEVFGEDAWFEPSESKGSSSIPEGEYDAKVVDLVVKEDIVISGKFLADIYEPVFQIQGKEVRHKGLFRFKKPDPAKYPNLQSDMGSNSNYYKFCDMLKIAQNKDGKLFLPQLDLDTLKQYQYKVVVVIESWTGREGNEMRTPRVKFVNSAQLEVNSNEEELPF
tara:strand:- start:372 stop:890 length:519 start_codon:yes stop_codon:yes gene_type:complete